MKINGILWLEDIAEKLLRKHHVDMCEVVEMLQGCPLFRYVEKGHKRGEDVYAAFGQSDAGRYLTVYFIYKKKNQALILSARDMTPAERRLHEKNK